MKGREITVNVKPYMYQYAVMSFGTDTIPLRRGRTLTKVIIPHLVLVSAGEAEQPAKEGFMQLKFELPAWSLTCEPGTDRKMYCYPLFRNRITEEGEASVRRFLANSFKNSFRVYMDAYIERQEETKTEEKKNMIKSGVVSFLMKYHIDVDERLVTSLTRDWYRHNEDNEQYKFSPMLY